MSHSSCAFEKENSFGEFIKELEREYALAAVEDTRIYSRRVHGDKGGEVKT